MKLLNILVLLLFVAGTAKATHNRAGEITYRQISELTYEVTVITYTYSLALADRPVIDISWGDNTGSELYRSNGRMDPSTGVPYGEVFPENQYKKNVYVGRHTFPGPGQYEIYVEDPNRNDGIVNIPNSVNIVFAVKTTLEINPSVGYNSTPVLLNPPYDVGAVGRPFLHNPGAYDPDGDSLSYRLAVCLMEDGQIIPEYTLPESSNQPIYITDDGDLVWDSPMQKGSYNVAIQIEEWRDGIVIGRVHRDMQIDIKETDNNLPQIDPFSQICVVAGDSVIVDVRATDPDNDFVNLTASGGPFEKAISPAQFKEQITDEAGLSVKRFKWGTHCSHARREPYEIVVKAEDESKAAGHYSLVNFNTLRVKVIPKSVTGLQVLDTTSYSLTLGWTPYECADDIAGFYVYRKEEPYAFDPDSCQTGLPTYTGYELVGTITNTADTTYYDDDNESRLLAGHQYCYRMVAYTKDGGLSYVSDEACATLQRGVPLLTKVSVEKTDSTAGEIYLEWIKPDPKTVVPAGYGYQVYRSASLQGTFEPLAGAWFPLTDTTMVDVLNTQSQQYFYKVGLATTGGQAESAEMASSVYIVLEGADNKMKININTNTPWNNKAYVVYRKNGAEFDSVGITAGATFVDAGLANGQPYTYRVLAYGDYPISDMPGPLLNYSQEATSIPIDTVPPCAPFLHSSTNCGTYTTQLWWTNPNESCSAESDVQQYKLYFGESANSPFRELKTLQGASTNSYTYFTEESCGLVGKFMVTAIDSFNNESEPSNIVYLDTCECYELPNIFTPNSTDANNLFKPILDDGSACFNCIDKIDLQMYNRYGELVFQTNDKRILWDGKKQGTGPLVPDGVYFYVCEVYRQHLEHAEPKRLVGFVHVYQAGGQKE